MGLESGTYVADLVPTNPAGSDQKAQGDDHIRLIKTVLKNTFPSGAGAPVPFGGWNGKTDAVITKTDNYTQLAADDGKLTYFSIAAAKTYTLQAAATAGNGFVAWVLKDGSVFALNVTAGDLINGQATIELGPNEGGLLYCTGATWLFLGKCKTLPLGESVLLRQEDDALAYPGLRLRRSRLAPVSNDLGAALDWEQKDNGGGFDIVARHGVKCVTPAAGNESYAQYFETIISGVRGQRLLLGQGLYTPSLLDKGNETLNVLDAYVEGRLPYPISNPRNCVFKNNGSFPNSRVDVSFDELIVRGGAFSHAHFLANGTFTLDIAVAGLNGLDTGAEAGSTWYYVWVIWDGATVGGLLSVSATAPTMPGVYTDKVLIGAIRNDGSSNFVSTWGRDRRVWQAPQNIFNNVGAAVADTYEIRSIAAGVPGIAATASGNIGSTATAGATGVAVASDNAGLGEWMANAGVAANSLGSFGGLAMGFRDIPLSTPQQLSWKATNTTANRRLDITGFTL